MNLLRAGQIPYDGSVTRPIVLTLVVVSLLVFALFGVWLFRQRQPTVEWVLINSHPAYQMMFSPLRGTEAVTQHFEAVLAERGIQHLEVQLTDALQKQHPYAWAQGDDLHIFYKSYSVAQHGQTLQIILSLDETALESFQFTPAQLSVELETMLYSALVSLKGTWTEPDLHLQGVNLYAVLNAQASTRLIVVQLQDDTP